MSGRTGRRVQLHQDHGQNPDATDPRLDPDFNTKYLVLGGEWFVARIAKIYTESKIDLDSVTATGDSRGQRVHRRLPV